MKYCIISVLMLSMMAPNGLSFSGFEHLFIGDAVTYHFPEDNTGLGQQLFIAEEYPYQAEINAIKDNLKYVEEVMGQYLIIKGENGAPDIKLSPGEIVALAGDYIANPFDTISKPWASWSELKDRFLLAYHYLIPRPDNWFWFTQIGKNFRLESYRKHLRESFQALFKAIENMKQEYPNQAEQEGKLHHLLISGKNAIHKIVEQAEISYEFYKYKELLSENIDHFEKDAIQAYTAGHLLALDKAIEAKELYEQGQDMKGRLRLNEAYTLEAFAQHFLSDSFAAGHILTLRRGLLELAKNNPEFASVDVGLMANAQHDETNWLGLVVRNQVGDAWIAYGDDGYFDVRDEDNAKQIKKTLQASIDEIWTAFNTKIIPSPDELVVTNLLPHALPSGEDILLSNGQTVQQTHNPLFKEKYGEFLIRANVNDFKGTLYKSLQPAFISSLSAWLKSPIDKYSSHDFLAFLSAGLAKKLTVDVKVKCFTKYYGAGLLGILNAGKELKDRYQAIYIPFSKLDFQNLGAESITNKTTMYFVNQDVAKDIYDQCTQMLGQKVINIRARAINLSQLFSVFTETLMANPNWLPVGVIDDRGALYRLRGYGEDYFRDRVE